MTETRQVMVLEENAAMRNFLYTCVQASGCDAAVIETAQDAIRRYRISRPEAFILSLAPTRPMRALRLIAVLHAIDPDVPLIVISGDARPAMVVQLLNRGATDVVTAPFDATDIRQALARSLRLPAPSRDDAPRVEAAGGAIVGSSPAMQSVRQFIARAAATDLNVLIRGESGTGKTLVARGIVAASLRRYQPFVHVHCARPDLLDAGETLASATDGTLLFDEIAAMHGSIQSALLKVLQDREHPQQRAAGGTVSGARIIATSSRDLEQVVAEGQLREELFFRLNVLSIHLPPLRTRKEDIPELAEHFRRHYAAQYGTPQAAVSRATIEALMAHDWPGNVRELENVMRRIVLLGAEELVTSELRPGRRTGTSTPGVDEPVAMPALSTAASVSLKEQARLAAREAERALILRTLEHTHWNRKEAAGLLGISYKALLKKIKDCDLQIT